MFVVVVFVVVLVVDGVVVGVVRVVVFVVCDVGVVVAGVVVALTGAPPYDLTHGAKCPKYRSDQKTGTRKNTHHKAIFLRLPCGVYFFWCPAVR